MGGGLCVDIYQYDFCADFRSKKKQQRKRRLTRKLFIKNYIIFGDFHSRAEDWGEGERTQKDNITHHQQINQKSVLNAMEISQRL